MGEVGVACVRVRGWIGIDCSYSAACENAWRRAVVSNQISKIEASGVDGDLYACLCADILAVVEKGWVQFRHRYSHVPWPVTVSGCEEDCMVPALVMQQPVHTSVLIPDCMCGWCKHNVDYVLIIDLSHQQSRYQHLWIATLMVLGPRELMLCGPRQGSLDFTPTPCCPTI